MKLTSYALIGALALYSTAASAQTADCTRGGQAPSSTSLDLDVIKCRLAIDAEQMGKLSAAVNQLTAALAISGADLGKARQDLAQAHRDIAAAEAQKTTLIEWLKAAQKDPGFRSGSSTGLPPKE
jgi:septal ring factor EnvC (AmiA/AmiB activator)